LGARPVLPVRVRAHPVAGATGRMRALAAELAKPAGPPPPPPLVPAPGVKTIVIDKSDQAVTLYTADGKALERFPCATGHTYPRVGTYKVTSRKLSSMYPADGSRFAHFVIFAQSDKKTNIGFHSIPIDREGNPIGGLGSPVSHGCVRLANDKAEFVYGWAGNGTKVVVQK
jgi:lipoprotein-anchoring transpeptidase ErfK/SrfK